MAHTNIGVKRPAGPLRRGSLSNWPVSLRLVAVFAVASLAGLFLGGLRVSGAISAADADGRTAQLAMLGEQLTVLAQAIENERDTYAGVAAYYELSQYASKDKAAPSVVHSITAAHTQESNTLDAAELATTKEAQRTTSMAGAIGAAFPASVQTGVQNGVNAIGQLTALRSAVRQEPPSDVISSYSVVLSELFPVIDQVTSGSGDPKLAADVHALGTLSRAKDQMSQQRAIMYATLIESSVNDAGGGKLAPFNNLGLQPLGSQALDDAGGLTALTTAQGLELADLTDFNGGASPALASTYQSTVQGQPDSFVSLIENFVTQTNDPRLIFESINGKRTLGIPRASIATTWYTDATAVIRQMRSVESNLAAEIVTRSRMLQRQETDSAVLTAAATVGVVLLMLVVTGLIGRTLVNPLRRLQADALEIATKRLPEQVAAAAASAAAPGNPGAPGNSAVIEPVGVRSTDEIGQVARAFDHVHAEAVRLAGTEAQLRGSLNSMFISLSRRSVPLIDRLAQMIDTMEQNENDPDQLADLFAMDHLVTRMRRNSENLLVLAGEEPVRKWTESVPLADVARAASAEIEQYNRVALAVEPGIMISGQAAADVVHLLAELVENATLFSPQDTQVRITVAELSSGGVLIEIRDDGVGVSVRRLAEMNWRLDHPPMVDVSVSRHMGLYAVSRLAARHGIRVRLRPGTPQGLSALVWLPGQLAKKELDRSDGQTRSAAVGVDAWAQSLAWTTRATRQGNGARSTSGQPALARRGVPAGRPGTVWFTAKRPSRGSAKRPEEIAADWQAARQSGAHSRVMAGGPAGIAPSLRAIRDSGSFTALQDQQEPAEWTASGLPRRVPRTGVSFGPDTPGSGVRLATLAAEAPLLGAPPSDLPARNDVPEEYPYERAPRRHSAEAARSRLRGFQLGSRDAAQGGLGGLGGRQEQHAGEENGR